MNVFTIALERVGYGEIAVSLLTRQATEEAARAYAEAAIEQAGEQDDLRVVAIDVRER